MGRKHKKNENDKEYKGKSRTVMTTVRKKSEKRSQKGRKVTSLKEEKATIVTTWR